MRRLICASVVLIWHKQVFSWRDSYVCEQQRFWQDWMWGCAGLPEVYLLDCDNYPFHMRWLLNGFRKVKFEENEMPMLSFSCYCSALGKPLQEWYAGHGSSIGSVSAWLASGPEFDSHFWHILSWRLGHEKIPTAILPLTLIQEEQLSVTGERMCTKYW